MAGIKEPLLPVPGFSFAGKSIGLADGRPDLGVALSERPCRAAGVFTRNNFPGAPVLVGREHLRDGLLQAVVVNSKNANVATGPTGLANARRICEMAGAALGIAPELVLPGSTGVIGVPLPMDKIVAACGSLGEGLTERREGLEGFARAIMTTDTRPKAVSVMVGGATLSGVAKGAGMIEPDMATMLAYFFTDAELPPESLGPMLARAVDGSFNRISVDGDTSTSDTVALLANGLAGPTDPAAFGEALAASARYLAREIVRDGEGATKLVELRVTEAPSPEAALAIAKSIINSPLVKTAIHGADPNWGRFVMAIGKVFQHPLPLEGLRIEFGQGANTLAIKAQGQSGSVLAAISSYLESPEIHIRVALGQGSAEETVWGCDLSEGYIRINADYTS